MAMTSGSTLMEKNLPVLLRLYFNPSVADAVLQGLEPKTYWRFGGGQKEGISIIAVAHGRIWRHRRRILRRLLDGTVERDAGQDDDRQEKRVRVA